MKRILQKIVLVFGGLALGVGLCEGLIRLAPADLLPPRLFEITQRMALYRGSDGMFMNDSELIFKIRPHYDAVMNHPDYQVRVKTHLNLDDIGFRGGALGQPAWAAAVGDSFTFGVGVEHEDTWVYLLAKALNREIVNLGIPAQGPPQYTRVLKRYALSMRPRAVLYGFYFNDLDTANRFYRMKRGVPVSRYLRHYSVLYNLIRERRTGVAQASAQPPGDVGGEKPSRAPVLASPPQADDGAAQIVKILERQKRNFERRWALTVTELDEALRACREAQTELVMLYLPSRWEVYWESIKARNNLSDSLDIERLRRTVVEYCDSRKIVCLDLTAELKRQARSGKELYFPIDGHWNKDGNRIVAETLQKFFTARGANQ